MWDSEESNVTNAEVPEEKQESFLQDYRHLDALLKIAVQMATTGESLSEIATQMAVTKDIMDVLTRVYIYIPEEDELTTNEYIRGALLEWLRSGPDLASDLARMKNLLNMVPPKQQESILEDVIRVLEMRHARISISQRKNREDVVLKDEAGNTYVVQIKNVRDAVKETALSPSVREVAFVSYGKGLATAGKGTADLDERYASLLSAYVGAYGRLEQKYAQLLGDLIHAHSPISSISQSASIMPLFGEGVMKEGSGSPPVASEQPFFGVSAVVRIEIDEDPLTVEHMGLLFSTLSALATKYWLISQGRFTDLIEFTKSHDERFVREAQAVITRISYNSPLNFDIKLSATDVAQGMVTTIDGIVQGKQRLKQMELATQTKVSEFHQAELRFAEELKQLQLQEAFEQEKRQLELERQQLELERLRLEVAQQQLGFFEARLEMQSKSLDHAFEIAQKVISQLHPQADEATKRMLVQTYVGDILQLTEISFTSVTVVEVDQASPVDNKDKDH